MFDESADLYDLVYSRKDYAAEAERLRQLVGREGGTLLDVACGTGRHLALLAPHYRAEGVDIDPAMVELTRARGLPAGEGDLLTLDMGRRFDVVTCLFSSIGYAADLRRAASRLAAHVAPGGILAIEPWLGPQDIVQGFVGLVSAETESVKMARMSAVHVDGRASDLELRYLIGRGGAITQRTERHHLWLWTPDEYAEALTAAGLAPTHDEPGLTGRGLWLATPAA